LAAGLSKAVGVFASVAGRNIDRLTNPTCLPDRVPASTFVGIAMARRAREADEIKALRAEFSTQKSSAIAKTRCACLKVGAADPRRHSRRPFYGVRPIIKVGRDFGHSCSLDQIVAPCAGRKLGCFVLEVSRECL